jgi:hypothetical protein
MADAVIPAIARMELHGVPIDVGAHRAQIARWQTELAAAQNALHGASPLRDLLKPVELQAHLYEVLDAETLATWPRTDSGRLTTRRQQLQLNSHLPALAELLQVRALQKLIDAFGDSLIDAVNPVTGRLHASFLIAGASTGRFVCRQSSGAGFKCRGHADIRAAKPTDRILTERGVFVDVLRILRPPFPAPPSACDSLRIARLDSPRPSSAR